MSPLRSILHVDMDAFFAAVEQLDHPELRGKPVLVGGAGRRGVVAAASYEARAFGCRSAQPTAVALRMCPQAIVVKGNHARYKQISSAMFEILESYSPRVQPLSIDEAFLDVTGSVRLFGQPRAIAELIRERIKAELGLTASVGVAPNKFLAKLASDLDKPDGLVVVDPDRIEQTLGPLEVSRLWGVGPAAEAKLAGLGVRTIGDLRGVPEKTLQARFGDFGLHLWRLARGIDDRAVHTDREAKSISHEQTFGVNLGDPGEVRVVLLGQAQDVARRLRRHERRARTVTMKVRFGDFETVTRARTLDDPADETAVISAAATDLFDTWAKSFRPVRLIGVGVGSLSDGPPQAGLFNQEERTKQRAIDSATDAIAERFGSKAVRRASSLPGDKSAGE